MKIPLEFVKRCKPVIEQQFQEERNALNMGDVESALLIQSMMQGLSFEQYRKLVESKGRQNNVLSALAELSVEIQHSAVIAIVQQIVDADLIEMTLVYARTVMKRIKKLEDEDGDEFDPYLDKLYKDAKEDIASGARQTRQWHRDQVRKMFD